jgi:HEAT repeat protein
VRYELTFVFAFILMVFAMPALAENVDQYVHNLRNENSTTRAEAAMALGELNDSSSLAS